MLLGRRRGQDALGGAAGSGEAAGPGTWSPFLQGEPSAGSIPTGLCSPLGSHSGLASLAWGSSQLPYRSAAL